MRNIFFSFFFMLLFSSCSNVVFVSPQPENIKPLTKIPEKLHGSFLIGNDIFIVSDSTIANNNLSSKNIVVKQKGNYFYVNILEELGYELYVFKVTQFLNYENIEMYYPVINDNVNLFEITNQIDDRYILENVSVNQMSILLNSVDNLDFRKVIRVQ